MFMGAQGVGRLGVMERDPLHGAGRAKLIEQAEELVVLVDSSKFRQRSSLIVCGLDRVHTIVTDDGVADEHAQMVEAAGVTLVVAEASSKRETIRFPEFGMSEPILKLQGISKSFPGVKALTDITFDVRPGEVHALLGENGAGKSTLIKIMSGVYQPDEGSIELDDKPISFDSPQEAQQAGIATIYQELLLFPELTVAENIFMGHAPKNRFGAIDWGAMRERAHETAGIARHPRPRCTCRGRRALGRQPPARGDRQGAFPQRPHPHHGRADGGADRARRGAALRDCAPPAGRAASAWSISATGLRRSSSSPTA